jgi:RluA family pseudouridine synthase
VASAGKNIIRLFAADESQSWVFPVLFEDDYFIALDKMTHMAITHSQLFPERPSLVDLIHHAIGANARWVAKRGIRHLPFAFRIDFETSGIALFCKNDEAKQKIGDLLGANEEQREFQCLTHGSPSGDSFKVDAKIGWVRGRPELMRAGKRGKHARTRFEVVERFTGFTLLRCYPETDRKHQIRAHLQHIKLPLSGDAYYGGKLLLLSKLKPNFRSRRDGTEQPLLDRVALHYSRLNFMHPFTGKPVAVESPLAKDIQVALKYLRKYSPAR